MRRRGTADPCGAVAPQPSRTGRAVRADRIGWSELGPTFEWVATRFTECASLEYELLAAGASGDLAYLVAIERITATVNGTPTSYALRATTIFRREDGVWKAVHRHGDPYRQDDAKPHAQD
ncbi:nuclear transport factor 2 family protein [Streptomyces sp. NPDC006365]|uniref:nuclear transport factor 2 family protein n=1 Tax=Streptomyces sp. NPDC006365 TaxID=3364744 RepID=UPI003699A32C